MSERQNIEWKQSWHDDYLKWVCGFANARNPKIAKACFMAGYIDAWGRGTVKIIQACKEAGLAEPVIEETNGGIAITLFKKTIGKGSAKVQDKSEEVRKEFGTLADRMKKDAAANNAFFQENIEQITTYLQQAFGITSEKLRKSFGKASEKELSNPEKALVIIGFFPETTAVQIGKIIGVSARSAENYIQKLKLEGYIERIGGKKEGTWHINHFIQ